MKLYHGSDVRIDNPVVSLNTGFADLGHGFYLTDNHAVAIARARSRARKEKADAGIVSSFAFDETSLPWITWDDQLMGTGMEPGRAEGFGLRFAMTPAGIAAWMNYIKACRTGATAVPGFGDPRVVRAWIATEEVEMACSGFVDAEELAALIEPENLVTQYCFRTQEAVDSLLTFVEAEDVGR